MQSNTSIHSHTLCRLVLIVPVIASMAFTACSDVAGTGGTHTTVNLQSATAGGPQTGDNVTIGRRTYDPETKNFDRPWPFGPEGGAQ
jgi:hypothetical protein